jgi:two-component system alkaline phosphatase synthesis response regulator PhoP
MELNAIKILVVDDEDDIREYLEDRLTHEGAIVTTASNGEEAIEKATAFEPDLILLDKMMPVKDGISTCIELRKIEKFIPTKILILSAIGDFDSQIEGLEIGADDYLVKPIKSELLISKIKSHLRRIAVKPLSNVLSYKHILADKSRFLVQIGDTEITIPKKEFELLFLLMSRPDYVFRRDEILDSVWGKEIIIGDRTIDVHIRKLREKIGEDYFKTVKGVGYKFVAF